MPTIVSPVDLDIQVRAHVLANPALYEQAGKDIDATYSPETFWQEDEKERGAANAPPGMTLEMWRSAGNRMPHIVERLLERHNADPGIPPADEAARVVVLHWLLTDQACNSAPVKLTVLQDWSIASLSHRLVRAYAMDLANREGWREFVQKALAVMRDVAAAESLADRIERQLKVQMEQAEAGFQSTLDQWQGVVRRFIPDYDIRRDKLFSESGFDRLAFLLCRYANVQPSEARGKMDLPQFFRWLELAADHRDADTPAIESAEPRTDRTMEEKPGAGDPPLRSPSADAMCAWRLKILRGINKQSEIAAIMSKELNRTINQGQVSRWLKDAEAYTKAGGIIQPLPTSAGQTIAVDPAVIDMGPRTDHRSRNQRDVADD